MNSPFPVIVSAALICLSTVLFSAEPNADALSMYGSQDEVFTGELKSVKQGPTARSFPPIHNHSLEVELTEILRGDLKVGDEIVLNHSARQKMVPKFPAAGSSVLIGASKKRGRFLINSIEILTPERVGQVRDILDVPTGWSMDEKGLRSPWAGLGEQATWPVKADGKTCSVTGRPTLLAGRVNFAVEKVPPAKDIKWTNPDGDGEYRITISNPNDIPLKVPALLSAGDKILWNESLVIRCQDKNYAVPGCKAVPKTVTSTTLKPGQSVSHVVNALALKGPEWPRGGYRIEFQFCLGEKSNTQSFYYMSRHHDLIRNPK